MTHRRHKDRFNSFAELAAAKTEGVDFTVVAKTRPPAAGQASVAVIAPHAGMIEPWTGGMAKAIAGRRHSLYIFRGFADGETEAFRELHLTSTKFDDPRAVKIADESDVTVTLHGCRGATPFIYIGGLDAPLKSRLADSFAKAGLTCHVDNHPFPATDAANICNRNKRGAGVQLEFSRALRWDIALRRTAVEAVRRAIAGYTP